MKPTIDYKRLGQRLKELREAHGLTQSQLAEAVGCTDGYISQMERSVSNPSLEFLVRASALYQVPVDYLLVDSACVLPEIQIDGRIAAQLARAKPMTLRSISDMIDILWAQQEALGEE